MDEFRVYQMGTLGAENELLVPLRIGNDAVTAHDAAIEWCKRYGNKKYTPKLYVQSPSGRVSYFAMRWEEGTGDKKIGRGWTGLDSRGKAPNYF